MLEREVLGPSPVNPPDRPSSLSKRANSGVKSNQPVPPFRPTVSTSTITAKIDPSLLASASSAGGPKIIAPVFIHPSARSIPQPFWVPNVTIDANCVIGRVYVLKNQSSFRVYVSRTMLVLSIQLSDGILLLAHGHVLKDPRFLPTLKMN